MTTNREKRVSLICKTSRALVAENATAVLVIACFARWFSCIREDNPATGFYTGSSQENFITEVFENFFWPGTLSLFAAIYQ
jgi:hypothetical protein